MGNPKPVPAKTVPKARILHEKQHDLSLRLIDAVRERPVLYNSKRIDYRNVDLKTSAWEEVFRETKMASVEACQKLWKTLRDRFIRELRVIENGGRAGSQASLMTPWPYFDHLMFYKDCGRAPRTYTRSVRKPRHSVASVSSSEESRDNPATAVASASTSTSNSPDSSKSISPSNLARTPRDSGSSSVSVPEVPSMSGFKHEASTSAFQEPLKTETAENVPGDSTEGISTEHRAFLDAVMDTASRLESEGPQHDVASSSRMPLRECPQNVPARAENIELACQGPTTVMPKHVQLSNLENQFLHYVAHGSRPIPEVPEVEEEALDLSNDSSASKNARGLVHAPRAVMAVPGVPPGLAFINTLAAAATCHASSSSPVSTQVHGGSPFSSPEPLDCTDESHITNGSSRKRKAVRASWPAKRMRLDDEDSLFALALIPSLRRLSGPEKSALKAKIMQSIADAECGAPTRPE